MKNEFKLKTKRRKIVPDQDKLSNYVLGGSCIPVGHLHMQNTLEGELRHWINEDGITDPGFLGGVIANLLYNHMGYRQTIEYEDK